MKRQPQLLFIAFTLGFSWLAMQVVHELGHVAAAWATGGRIAELRLHPLAISYTLLAENPRPGWVAWMGPIAGVALPLLAWITAAWTKIRGWQVARFFAGFCLLANGAYLAAGSFNGLGDAGDLMRHDTPQYFLWLFGLVTIPLGLWLWNGLGRYFGIGQGADSVDRKVFFVVTTLLLAIVVLELTFA
jgi:hypothetical protein